MPYLLSLTLSLSLRSHFHFHLHLHFHFHFDFSHSHLYTHRCSRRPSAHYGLLCKSHSYAVIGGKRPCRSTEVLQGQAALPGPNAPTANSEFVPWNRKFVVVSRQSLLRNSSTLCKAAMGSGQRQRPCEPACEQGIRTTRTRTQLHVNRESVNKLGLLEKHPRQYVSRPRPGLSCPLLSTAESPPHLTRTTLRSHLGKGVRARDSSLSASPWSMQAIASPGSLPIPPHSTARRPQGISRCASDDAICSVRGS